MSTTSIPVVVRQIRLEAEGVHAFELAAARGGPLPAFDAGAHVDLELPGRLRRSYSLCGAPGRCCVWRIAVQREQSGRGASAWLHDQARVGQVLQASRPVNGFALAEDAPAQVFVAGGIGVTALMAMVERLAALGRPWRLHYTARTLRRMAFRERLGELAAEGQGKLVLHASAESGRMDLGAIVAAAPGDACLYASGPAGLLDAFVDAAAAAGFSAGQMRVEHFTAAGRQGSVVEPMRFGAMTRRLS
jgi:ferredoxin-NADP reductase